MNAFNHNVKLIRSLTRLTQPLFAQLIKSNPSNVKTYETTVVQSKDLVVLQALSEVAGVTIEDLKDKRLKKEDVKINVEMVEAVKNPPSIISEPAVEYKIISADFLAGKLEGKDETIAQIEARRLEAMALAEKMEAHYKDMVAALERAQNTINEVLKPMVTSLKEIPPVLDSIVRNSNEHDKEIMKALDRLVGNAPGTLQKEAGKRILKGALEQQKKDK